MTKVFLDHINGAFAFFKEEEVATWEASKHREAIIAESIPGDVPATYYSGIDVSAVRTVVINGHPSDQSAFFDLVCFAGNQVLPAGDRALARYATFLNLEGNSCIKLDVHGIDFLYIMCSSLSTGTLDVFVGLISFETTS